MLNNFVFKKVASWQYIYGCTTLGQWPGLLSSEHLHFHFDHLWVALLMTFLPICQYIPLQSHYNFVLIIVTVILILIGIF
jgi:hypothetical protein